MTKEAPTELTLEQITELAHRFPQLERNCEIVGRYKVITYKSLDHERSELYLETFLKETEDEGPVAIGLTVISNGARISSNSLKNVVYAFGQDRSIQSVERIYSLLDNRYKAAQVERVVKYLAERSRK